MNTRKKNQSCKAKILTRRVSEDTTTATRVLRILNYITLIKNTWKRHYTNTTAVFQITGYIEEGFLVGIISKVT
jgi:hypothetical protein